MSILHTASLRRVIRIGLIGAMLASLSATALARDESGLFAVILSQRQAVPGPGIGAIQTAPAIARPAERAALRVRPARSPARPHAVAASARKIAPTDAAASDWTAAILADRTLRRGDVVMFPGGPKVFRGKGSAPWTTADFEAIETSGAISAARRSAVFALTSGRANAEDTTVAALAEKPLVQVATSETVIRP